MNIIRGIIGLIFIVLLGFLVSSDRKAIKKRLPSIGIMVIIQLIITFVGLRTTAGISILSSISEFFNWLMAQAAEGVNFVFGGIVIEDGASVFLFNVLLPLVFLSGLIAILNYIKVLPFLQKWIGFAINKITGVGELEGQFAISTMLLGQPGGYLTIKELIPKISGQRMFTLALSATATTGASMLGAYMQIIPGEYVVVAVFLNVFSAFIISSLINPYSVEADEEALASSIEAELQQDVLEGTQVKEKQNFFDMLSDAMSSGFGLAIGVAATMIGFIALIAFLNNGLLAIIGISFTQILGYIFAPLAYIIGIPSADIVEAGGVMATKLLTNELIGMNELMAFGSNISVKTQAMIGTYLVSFANFGSIGIVTGALKAIDPKQSKNISSQSLKLILGATMSGLLTATIVGFFF